MKREASGACLPRGCHLCSQGHQSVYETMKGEAFRGAPRALYSQLGESLHGFLCLPLQWPHLLGRWQHLIEGTCSDPSFQGVQERDLRILPINTLEGDVSPRTLAYSRELRRFGDRCIFLLTDGRVCLKQSFLSHSQAAAAFSFLFKTLLSTSWNISPSIAGSNLISMKSIQSLLLYLVIK